MTLNCSLFLFLSFVFFSLFHFDWVDFQVPPTNLTKLEGEKAIFTCEAKAMPGNVTVRWFREGSPVREVASLETRVTIRKDGSLIINPVSADDSGQYLCEVSNGIGDPQSASAYLNVECMQRCHSYARRQYVHAFRNMIFS